MPDISKLPDIDVAMERLAAAETAEAQEVPPPAPISEQVDSPSDAQPPTPETDGSTPNSLPTDTPAAAEPKKEQPTEPQKKTETPKDEPGKSKYAKSQERLDKTWENANKRKTELDAKEQALAQRETQIKQQEERFERQSAKASAKYKPEDYEQYGLQAADRAKSYELQAKGLEKEAEELEGDGKFAEAQQQKARASELREAAIVQKHQAKQAKAQADHLRTNPEPTAKQLQEKIEAQKREFTMKAASKWPDLAKEGSEFQKTVVGHLQALAKDSPELAEYPGIIYHVARLTAAETTAARVPGLEKELGVYKAKVKELEAFTAPGGGNSAATKIATNQQPASEEEEREMLRQEAMRRG